MIVVAGRPGSGKTSLALNIAANVASQGTPIGIFSLEMTAVQLQQRLICSKAKVNLSDALTGRLTLAHNTDIQRAKNWLKNYPIFIDDNPYLSPEVLRRKVLRMINRHGVKAIVIDYLQLMRSKGNSLHEKVTYISQAVKGIALEYSVPIIVLAQLNRQPEAREDGEPRVSDLRDSGSIEQDADIVMLIHRVDLYQGTNTGDTKIIVGKNRRGHTGFVPATYLGDYTLFIEQ
jgi:replicative DNA helicase